MRIAIAALVAAALAATAAGAQVITTTYTGVIGPENGATDTAGLFGPAGAYMAGDAFTAVFVTDWGLEGTTLQVDPGVSSSIYGGGSPLLPSPTSAVLTINGVTLAISGEAYAQSFRGVGGGVANFWSTANDERSSILAQVYSYTDNFLGGGDVSRNFRHTLTPDDVGGGGVYACGPDPAICTNLTFAPVTVSSAGGVPEPAAWSLMILGAGLAGEMMRRARAGLPSRA